MHSIGLVATPVHSPDHQDNKNVKCKVNSNLRERLDWARWAVLLCTWENTCAVSPPAFLTTTQLLKYKTRSQHSTVYCTVYYPPQTWVDSGLPTWLDIDIAIMSVLSTDVNTIEAWSVLPVKLPSHILTFNFNIKPSGLYWTFSLERQWMFMSEWRLYCLVNCWSIVEILKYFLTAGETRQGGGSRTPERRNYDSSISVTPQPCLLWQDCHPLNTPHQHIL